MTNNLSLGRFAPRSSTFMHLSHYVMPWNEIQLDSSNSPMYEIGINFMELQVDNLPDDMTVKIHGPDDIGEIRRGSKDGRSIATSVCCITL